MKKVNVLKIDNGLYLDGLCLEGVTEYSLIHPENSNTASLTLKMDVVILPTLSDKVSPDLNCLVSELEKGG